MTATTELEQRVQPILARFARQNAWPDAAAAVALVARRLAAEVVAGRRAAGGGASPRSAAATEAEVAAWSEPVLAPLAAAERARFAVPVRQLLKACAQPPLAVCRNSYREAGADGLCRRQELARARARASGSHCIDCPWWTECAEPAHRELLRAAWTTGADEREAHWDIFLPEDFRRLRQRLAESPAERYWLESS